MNSRTALSALWILIAAMVLAAQDSNLQEKIQVWGSEISQTHSLLVLYRSCTNQPHASGTLSPDAATITFNFPNATHCLGSHARRLQHFVLNLIDADHQGE